MLSVLGLPYIHPWVPKVPLISSFSFSHILTNFLSPLEVSLISLMNTVENFLICKPVVSWPSCCYLFPNDISRIESTQIYNSPHRMEKHSWMGNEIASLWSVISYLGSHIVPGFLVQTISRIIALIKKVNFIILWFFMEDFSFSVMMKNVQCRNHRTVIRTLRLGNTCSFNNCVLGKSNEVWSPLLWHLFHLSIAV